MHEELSQIEKNKTWDLISRPANKNVIGAKWVLEIRWMIKEMLLGIRLD